MPNITIKEAKERAEILRKDIAVYSKAYYDNDAPLISDAAYDQLLLELRTLEETYPELVTPDSPTQHVGGHASSSFADVKHLAPLQSLRDVFDQESITSWYDNCLKKDVTVETKVDGLSCAITYIDGKFASAATRGDGKVGEDVTENVRQIANVPKTLTGVTTGTIIIRCEIYMPKQVFEQLNKDLEAKSKKLFKTPRNAAAGSLRTKDAKETGRRGLHAIAFAILYNPTPLILDSQSETLDWLKKQGFETVDWALCKTRDEISAAIAAIDERRNSYDFPIDGAVIKQDSLLEHTRMGGTDKYPHWAIAYKYPPEQKETTLLDIALQTGRTGVITPIAVFEPVELAGTTVVRATLHNQDFMDTVLGGIAIGDKIIVHKSGEIIPEVLKVLHDKRPAGAKDFTIDTCPVCGAHAVIGADENGNGTQMYCSNPDCPAILERRLIYWCSDHVMAIDGVGPKIAKALIDNGLSHIADLYQMTEEDLASIKAIGPVRAPKLYASIQKSKDNNIDRLIAGLGIQGVGRHIGQMFAANYPDMDSIITACTQGDITSHDGIGELMAFYMEQFFKSEDGLDFISRLKELGVNMISRTYHANDETSTDRPLEGITFVITGTLPGISRNDAKALLESYGAKISGSVSKKTNYLLAGEDAGSKLTKASELGVPILSFEEVQEMIEKK